MGPCHLFICDLLKGRTGKRLAKARWVGALRSYIAYGSLSACPWGCVLCAGSRDSLIKDGPGRCTVDEERDFSADPLRWMVRCWLQEPEPPNAASQNSDLSSISIIQSLVSKSPVSYE